MNELYYSEVNDEWYTTELHVAKYSFLSFTNVFTGFKEDGWQSSDSGGALVNTEVSAEVWRSLGGTVLDSNWPRFLLAR